MKAIIALLFLFCFLFSSCSKKDYSNTEKQEEEKQEVLSQETID
jgi:PBP1b-binding outer membrane lipoprotein LpoB